MRIKKILSLAVVLAMVMAAVPVFGITASAAGGEAKLELSTTEFIDAIGEKPEALVFDGSYAKVQATDNGNCEKVSSKYNGWSATYSTDNQTYSEPSNLRYAGLCSYETTTVADSEKKWRNYIKFQRYSMAGKANGDGITADDTNQYAKVTAPEAVYNGSSKDVFVIDYTLKHNLGETGKVQNKENIAKDDLYGTFLFSDADDQTFAVVWMDGKKTHNGDNDGTIKYDTNGLVGRDKDALYRIMVVNDDATNTHSLYYEADLDGNGYVLQKRANGLEGIVKGFKELKVSRPNYNDYDTLMAIGDLKIYAADLTEIGETADVTVQYMAGSDAVGSYKVKKLVGSSYAPAVNDYYINDAETAVYKVTDKNVQAVKVNAGGTTISVPVTKFRDIEGKNLVTNGGFESNSFDGWTTSSGQTVDTGRFSITKDASKGEYAVSTVKSNQISDAETIKNTVKISETGTYFISVDVKGTYKSSGGDPATQYMWLSAGGRHLGGDNMAMNTSSFTTYSYVEPVLKNSEVFVEGYYFQDYHPIIDNFVVYKLAPEENEKSLTVEYQVDGKTVFTDGGVYTPETVDAGVYYEAKYYYDSAKGAMYSAPSMEYKKDTVVTMDAESTKFHIGNMAYNVSDEGNIVTNGTFDKGMDGWKAGSSYNTELTDTSISSKFEVLATDGDHTNTLKMTGNEGSGGNSTLHTYWPVTSGETYYFAYDTIKDTGSNTEYGGITMLKDGTEAAVADKATVLYSIYGHKVTEDKKGIADNSNNNNWYKAGTTWDRKAYVITIPEGADGLGLRVGFSKDVRIDNVVLYKLEGQSLPDVTVTLKDSEGQQQIGEKLTLKARGYDGEKVVVANGIYNKQYYLDKDVVASTTGDAGALTAEVNVTGKLDKFTWNTTTNKADIAGFYDTYNGAHLETWSGNGALSGIESYVYVDVPKKEPEQKYVIKMSGKWYGDSNPNEGNSNAPGFAIYFIDDDEAVKGIDLANGEETTKTLAALTSDENEIVKGSGDTRWAPIPEDYNREDKSGFVQYVVPDDKADILKEGPGVIKLFATRRGSCTINEIQILAVTVPSKPTASLGWDGNDFTANFTPAEADSENVTGFNVKVAGGGDGGADINKSYSLGEKDKGIAILPDSTNAILQVSATNVAGASEAAEASIYSLVMKKVKDFATENADKTINTAQLEKVNDVLKNGGLYITNVDGEYSLTEEVKGVLEIAQPKGDNLVTITITKEAASAGLKFAEDIKSGGKDVNFVSANEVTVDVSGLTQDAAVLSLDAVYLEFVPSEITESEADFASGEVETVEEL